VLIAIYSLKHKEQMISTHLDNWSSQSKYGMHKLLWFT